MNKELRQLACLNVKNYISQRKQEVRFLALGTDRPIDSRDIVQQQFLTPLPCGFPKLTPVRCERLDNNCPVETVYLSEETLLKFVYSEDWRDCSSLRICEGDLLRRISEEINLLLTDGRLVSHKRARFDSACFTFKPTAFRDRNLYEKNMIPEIVKITFCYYALDKSKMLSNLLDISDQIVEENALENKADPEEEESLSQASNRSKSGTVETALPEDKPTEVDPVDAQENRTKESFAMVEIPLQATGPNDADENQENQSVTTGNQLKERRNDENVTKDDNASETTKSNDKSVKNSNESGYSGPNGASVQGGKILSSASKASDVGTESKVTRSDMVVSGRRKSKSRKTETSKKGNSSRGTGQSHRGTLEFDQFGKPKFKPSFETIVNVAAFKFSRCSSDSDDSDCDRVYGKENPFTWIKRNRYKLPKKCKKKCERVRDPHLKDTVDMNENYAPSDSDEEEKWLNGVPPAPNRHDVKSLKKYFHSKRKLKYGKNEKLIVFKKDSDYFPPRVLSGKSYYKTATDSTQGMSYFNPLYHYQQQEVELAKLTYSGLSLPNDRSNWPRSPCSSNGNTEIKNCSFEAICGSHNNMAAARSSESILSDRVEECHSSRRSSTVHTALEDQGTMHLMNIELMSLLKPNYSHERLLQMSQRRYGDDVEYKTRWSRDAPLKQLEKVMNKAATMSNDKIKDVFMSGLYKSHVEEFKPIVQQQGNIIRNKYDPDQTYRPVNGMYKVERKHHSVPSFRYENLSPPMGILEKPLPELFEPEIHTDLAPHILKLVQDFIVTKEIVSRKAGKNTIVSITITRPMRNRFGTKHDVQSDIEKSQARQQGKMSNNKKKS